MSGSSLPTWVTITVKVIGALVLLTSLAYLSANAYAIAEFAGDHKSNKNKPELISSSPSLSANQTSSSDTPHTIQIICFSISMITSFFATLSSIGILFTCYNIEKKHCYSWLIVQSILLVILILSYLIPFSFSKGGDHETVHKFLEKTGNHFGDVVEKAKDFHDDVDYVVHYAFFVHSVTVLVGCILVGVIVGLGAKEGYQSVY